MADIGDQSLRLIRPPFLIAEEEEYDDHGPAKDMVIEILFENAASDQDVYQRIEQPRRTAMPSPSRR